jgi:hypothetical protein
MTEIFEAVPFQEPSPQLFELLDFLECAHEDLSDVMIVEFSTEDLRGFGELSERMADRLLTRGAL